MAFSNGGGTLALPSPTSLHGDAGPSVRSLRRSLSRSPSRFHLMRGDSHNSQHSDSSSSSALPSPCPRPHTTTSTAVTAASTTPTHAPPLHHTSLSASSSASSISSEYNFTSSTPLATAATTAPASAFAPASAPVSTTLYYRDHSGPFSTPLRSGARLSLRSVRPKTVSAKPISRLRPSPKSPLKRALTTNSDLANASPSTTPQSAGPSTAFSEPLLGQENGISGGTKFSGLFFPLGSPPHDKMDKPSRHSVHLDTSGDSRLEALSSNVCSPLKRSDAIMSLDQVNPGSPVAKRRSLHGITSLGGEFNIFDFASPNPAPSSARSSFEIHDDSSSSNDQPASPTAAVASLSVAAAAGASSSFSSFSSFSSSLSSSPPTAPAPVADPGSPFSTPTVTKRTSSLRRSTLQQRHDPRSSWGRRQGEKYLAQQQQLLAQHLQQQQDQDQQDQQGAAVSSSPKITQQLKKASNDWLFTAPNVRSRPRASLDQLLKPEPRETPFKVKGPLANPSVHTLERPLGLASSTATHMHQPHPLSRTLTTSSSGSSMPDDSPTHFPVQLPPDRPRPTSIFARSLPLNAHRPRPDPIATPQYKSARPLQSVFASAGLVSKMNRNAEDDSLQQAGGRRMVMPDTPCKKQVYPSNTYPPSSGSGRKQQQRRFFFSAAPETPFNTSTGAGSGSGAAQPQNASASTSSTTSENVANFFKRRSTHARKGSILSLDGDISDSQCAVDSFDLPPTPTKSVLAKNLFGSASKGTSTPIAVRDLPTGPLSFTPDAAPPRRSPLPLSSPVGSLGSEKMSPKTPREHNIFSSNDFLSNMAPPDASRLSISNNNSNNSNNNNASKLGVSIPANRSSSMIFPPATPTADREAFASFVDRRVSITPVHGAAPKDADVVLGSMFGKVECVGKGEFSQVFRVNTRDSSVYGRGPLDYFSTTPSKRASSARAEITPTPSLSASGSSSGSALPRVFAVKKVRLPYFGQREREAKLREVAALEAVRDCENVLQIFDHWEQNGHLYIQTEYCDEGGMDGFLKKVGEHGRLDDFRIWKILLEVSQVCYRRFLGASSFLKIFFSSSLLTL